MGRVDEGWKEHFHTHVEEETSRRHPADSQMLHVLDRVVEALLQRRGVPGMEALAVRVLTLRVNLWAPLLVKRQTIAPAIAQGVQVVVSTATMLTKFKAGFVQGWPRALRHDDAAIWGLCRDEYQRGGWEEVSAATLGKHWALFLGDGEQAREPTGDDAKCMLGGSLLNKRPPSHGSPLEKHTAVHWLARNIAQEVDTIKTGLHKEVSQR